MVIELSIMDYLLIILAGLFIFIAIAMRRLRNRMEADMQKDNLPFMSMRHMFKKVEHGHEKKKKR
jgi:hypothetical protein